jgi:hypothetical protein
MGVPAKDMSNLDRVKVLKIPTLSEQDIPGPGHVPQSDNTENTGELHRSWW